MSTSCTMAGFSVPFKDEYQENDFLIKYFKVSNEDELQDLIYSSDKTNQWELADDYENKGLVFRTHNDRDDINTWLKWGVLKCLLFYITMDQNHLFNFKI
jgi:hypothetical protein